MDLRARRHRLSAGTLLAAGFAAATEACSISGVVSAAQPTALERQLLGEYDELDEALLHASSVRGGAAVASVAPRFEALRAEALDQRAVQRFNEDDLLELKKAHCIAEGLDAAVVARPCSAAGADPAVARRLARVVEEENRARRAILTWAAYQIARSQGRVAPDPTEMAEVRKAYHQLLLEAAALGNLVEVEPGVFREAAR